MKIRVTGYVTYFESKEYEIDETDIEEATVKAQEQFLEDFSESNDIIILEEDE